MAITHPQIAAARDALAAFCGEMSLTPSKGRTIVIHGENGSGKSRIAKSVSRWFRETAVDMPLVYRSDDLDADQVGTPYRCFKHWPTVVDDFKKRQSFDLDDLMACNLLVLDDIGAEHDPSGFGREQLYLILSRREFRWNLITTNFAPDKWDSKFERRIASRLYRNAEHIDFSQVPDFSTI